MEKKRSERSDERKKDEAIPQGREECISADVAVIGAGASGMAAAVAAAAQGCSVVIAEGNDRAGKKLYATGNGRCNFTNEECTPESFNRPEDRFVESILNFFGTEETLRFFDSEGMMARLEEGGRYYPYSGQASAVVKTLERAVKRSGCRFLFSDRAVKTGFSENGSSGDGYFRILTESGRRLICRRLIVACGGRAGLKTGSTGDGYGFAKSFGHTLKPPRPALTAAESDAEFLGNLKGVRARGSVSLYEKDESPGESSRRRPVKIAEETGEIQFTGTGISGICVFDLTRYMEGIRPPAPKKKKKKGSAGGKRTETEQGKTYIIVCDFVPGKSGEELYRMLRKYVRDGKTDSAEKKISLQNALEGIVNSKLAGVIADLSGGDVSRAADMLHHFEVPVSCTRGWEEAQVTCGGVRREEIFPGTLESRLQPGLFFCGEVIDVDGRCGGFNLQWAWSSGTAAGRAAGRKKDMGETQKGEKKC